MPDRETWRFINTFAPWFSALGTLTAVIVSLYLARRASRLKVHVNIAIVRLLPHAGAVGNSPEFFSIRAVNHGRDAVLQGLVWRRRWFKRQTWIVLPPDDPYSTKLPTKLAFGEQAQFLFPTATFNKQAEHLLKHVNASTFPVLTVRALRAGVFASTGQEFVVSLDEHMRKFVLERSEQVQQSSA